MRAAVIGAGSWGTAFAGVLAGKGIRTGLWVREPEILAALERTRENPVFLPGRRLPPGIEFTAEIGEAMRGADAVFVAVPSGFCRPIYAGMAPHLKRGQAAISLTKGIDPATLRRMTEIMREVFGGRLRPGPAVLSGPSFAREVAEGHPTALVLASRDAELGRRLQHAISSGTLRIYTSRDVAGVEIAGAAKNVIAIAAGILDGLELGLNLRAALISRGLVEITRLGLALGGRRETFAGLAGVGDLVLTCTGRLSRNHAVGVELGRGSTLRRIQSGTAMVAEGVETTRSFRRLSRRLGVEMPICEQVYQILYEKKNPRRALVELMTRALKKE